MHSPPTHPQKGSMNKRARVELDLNKFSINPISIETCLNSRCSSDFDGDPKKNHWGIYIDSRPSENIINKIVRCCQTPRFSDGKLITWFEGNYLFLGFETVKDAFEERILHIESGMQHQAVHLACAALGVGTCIHNMGINGTQYDNRMATARHLILEMADCYETGKYTEATPDPPFQKGKSLPEPKRTGCVECLLELEKLEISRIKGVPPQEEDISQLLWAAKGRTPHYVGGNPWGLTIPTWGGRQEYTNVYLVKNFKLYRYINWTRQSQPLNKLTNRLLRYVIWKLRGKSPFYIIGNPTHDVELIRSIKRNIQLDEHYAAIILSRNENTNRAFWEVGYMLENMLLQLRSLEIPYRAKIFRLNEISELTEIGIKDAVAALIM